MSKARVRCEPDAGNAVTPTALPMDSSKYPDLSGHPVVKYHDSDVGFLCPLLFLPP